jgi:hypothetical protein
LLIVAGSYGLFCQYLNDLLGAAHALWDLRRANALPCQPLKSLFDDPILKGVKRYHRQSAVNFQ